MHTKLDGIPLLDVTHRRRWYRATEFVSQLFLKL